MLATSLDVMEIAAHSPDEIDWDSLPEGFLVAMHWHRTAAMEKLLEARTAEVLVTVRHPLDILISILRFCQFEPATARWLDGEGGTESPLIGTTPTDTKFLDYALSERAAALFSVSMEWRQAARAIIRYEELVDRPHQTLNKVLNILAQPAASPIDETIRSFEMPRMKAMSAYHCWLGRPGLWKHLIVDEYRHAIYARHRVVFDTFGYLADAAPLNTEEALYNWTRLTSSQ
jgi:hypothetical protein